jgi:hypothetical protein
MAERDLIGEQIKTLTDLYNSVEAEQNNRLAQLCALLATRRGPHSIRLSGKGGLQGSDFLDSPKVNEHFLALANRPITVEAGLPGE